MDDAAFTREQRVLRSRIGGYSSWARTEDRSARTAPARAASPASLDRWEREVDPDCVLDPADRAQRAESARRAYFTRLALRSSRSRSKAAAARRRAAELEAEAQAADAELDSGGDAA
jgi:hypothetical protein